MGITIYIMLLSMCFLGIFIIIVELLNKTKKKGKSDDVLLFMGIAALVLGVLLLLITYGMTH